MWEGVNVAEKGFPPGDRCEALECVQLAAAFPFVSLLANVLIGNAIPASKLAGEKAAASCTHSKASHARTGCGLPTARVVPALHSAGNFDPHMFNGQCRRRYPLGASWRKRIGGESVTGAIFPVSRPFFWASISVNHALEKQEISCQARIQCRVSELDRFGRGKQVLVVIVINQPVVCKVALPQPRGGDLIYRQEPHGWEKIPPQVPTLQIGRASCRERV